MEISIELNSGSTELPKEGWHHATLVDVKGWQQWEDNEGQKIKDDKVDLYEGEKKLRDKLQFHFETEQVGEDGMRLRVKAKPVNQTLNPKSNLRKMIDDIDDTIIPKMIKEKVPFTPELILGRAAKIKVFHNESNGSVYANIKSIMEVEKIDADDAPPY